MLWTVRVAEGRDPAHMGIRDFPHRTKKSAKEFIATYGKLNYITRVGHLYIIVPDPRR